FTTPLSIGFTKPAPGKFFNPSKIYVRMGTSASQNRANILYFPTVTLLHAYAFAVGESRPDR
ncbi:MAG: hypothetical protein VX491_07080, partial [Pseudomonadota bacterium]|nr:hypothetical protein [Pseudomonadota bacterium]